MFSQSLSRPKLLLAAFAASAVFAASGAIAQSPASRPYSAARGPAPHFAQQIRIPASATSPRPKNKPEPEIRPAQTPAQNREQAPPQNPLVNADAAAVYLPNRPASLVRQAAHGELVEELPPRQLTRSAVRQVGHAHSHTQDCGCDHCSSSLMDISSDCGAEPTCGLAGGCGIAGCQDPSCGFEATGCDGYGCEVGSCDQCADGCLPVFRIGWKRFEFFAGVNSFTGPANHAIDENGNHAGTGSFGFYEGVNEGRSLNRLLGLDLAAQLGMRATQSNLSGAESIDEARKQIFVTGGLFRRVDFGLQYGLVVDYLYDDWWYQNNLVQLRGELSWNDACGHEFGYQFMAGTKDSTFATQVLDEDDELVTGTGTFEATTQHRLFLRGNTAGGGSYQAFAGGTERGDGLLGATLMSAFRGRFAVQGGVTYLVPSESNDGGGYENEAWNLAMGIVFRPGGKAGCGRYCRPLFDVADNGTFIVDRR